MMMDTMSNTGDKRNIIELNSVSAGYEDGRDIIKDITLDIREGSCLSILGSNGCGKTTLLRAICGFIHSSGDITIAGKNLSKMKRKEIASYIGFFSQMPQIYFPYTVYETVMQGRYMHRAGGLSGGSASDKDIVEETIVSLGLENIAGESITKLSGGQLQRVMLARCMAQRSPILILDEPMNHLDMKVQSELMDYLDDWRKKPVVMADGNSYMPTMICVFHELFLAAQMADDIAFLKNGRLMLSGSKEEMLTASNLNAAFDFDVFGYVKKRTSYIKE